MNLSDLIRWQDRSLKLRAGRATLTTCAVLGQRCQAVVLEPGTCLVLSDAHEFTALRTFPPEIGWQIAGEIGQAGSLIRRWRGGGRASLEVRLVSQRDGRSHALFSGAGPCPASFPIRLDWPLWQSGFDRFDIVIETGPNARIVLAHGPLFDSGKMLLPILRGSGAEVGPGANPVLRSDSQRSLIYVEAASADAWRALYEKGKSKQLSARSDLWAKYVVGDARTIDCCPAHSLDFIFSKHVLEHLVNPIQVFENWAQKLSAGGVIAGVIPDLRYTFDLRQPPSTTAEWIAEYEQGLSEAPRRAYERWCRYTAPYNTPEDLIARNYSSHMHYYTPDNFVDLLQLLCARSILRCCRLRTSPNHKDFAFATWT